MFAAAEILGLRGELAIAESDSQLTRSMSWVARSLTTPTSWIRDGNGPLRMVEAVNSRPIWPRGSRRRSSCSAGLKRSTCPTAPITPALRADLDDPARVGGGTAERLLDQHRDPGWGEALDRGKCRLVGTETIAKSSGAAVEQLVQRAQDEIAVMDGAVAISSRVDRPDEIHAVGGLEQSSVVAADHAKADHPTAQLRISLVAHHAVRKRS